MGVIVRIFTWLVGCITLLKPFLPALFGVAVYSGFAALIYKSIDYVQDILSVIQNHLLLTLDDFSALMHNLFDVIQNDDMADLLIYVLSLDVPINWLATFVVDLLSQYLVYAVGGLIYIAEVGVSILSIIWVRKRLKLLIAGLTGGSDA